MTEVAATNVDPVRQARRRRWKRFFAFTVVLLIGVAIGWWLHPKCKTCPQPGNPSKRSASVAAASNDRLQGDGNSGPMGSGPGAAASGSVDGAMGAAKGTGPDGAKRDTPVEKVVITGQKPGLGAPPILGDGPDEAGPTHNLVRSAADFTYDRTGLPRYPDSVKGVFSETSVTESGEPDGRRSNCTIVTTSDFNTVVAWYRAKLPTGWHDRTVGDLAGLAAQVSPDSIRKLLMQAGSGAQPGAPAAPATSGSSGASVAMFSPPDGTRGDLGVMIRQQPGKPVTILMNKAGG